MCTDLLPEITYAIINIYFNKNNEKKITVTYTDIITRFFLTLQRMLSLYVVMAYKYWPVWCQSC